MGTFAQRELVASSLGRCGAPVPITRDAAVPSPSFDIGRGTRVVVRSIAQEPGTSLAWLLACLCAARCCLGPRGVGFALVSIALTAWPAPAWKGSARSQIQRFSGLCVRFRATPFTSLLSLFLLRAFAFSRYTTERLTRPYSGRPTRSRGLLLDRQPLPGCPIPPLPIGSRIS